jgi:hypothetical protein
MRRSSQNPDTQRTYHSVYTLTANAASISLLICFSHDDIYKFVRVNDALLPSSEEQLNNPLCRFILSFKRGRATIAFTIARARQQKYAGE